MTLPDETPPSLTDLIHAWSDGLTGASNALADQVYCELHKIASAHLSREQRAELEPAELVHEAWIRMGRGHSEFPSRKHFFAFAALQMRRLLIDCARGADVGGRRGDLVTLSLRLVDPAAHPAELTVLMDALEQLDRKDARKSQAFTLAELGGFNNAQVAEMLDVSCATIERDLRFARTWLAAQMI